LPSCCTIDSPEFKGKLTVNGHDIVKIYLDTIELDARRYMKYRTIYVYPQVDKQIDIAIQNIAGTDERRRGDAPSTKEFAGRADAGGHQAVARHATGIEPQIRRPAVSVVPAQAGTHRGYGYRPLPV
jgi:hypothetical protein